MSKTLKFKTDFLNNTFIKISIPWAKVDQFYLALHTASPGDNGNQTTNEANYSNYSRQEISRDKANWTINNDKVSNKKTVEFPVCIGAINNINHISIQIL